MQQLRTFLTFPGTAEEAMNFYTLIFDDSAILNIERYGPHEEGVEGAVRVATFSLEGQHFMAIDTHIDHAWTFTPAISIHVSCKTTAKVDRLYNALVEGGDVFMPLDSYPFSPRYSWLADRFGVSWQLMYTDEIPR